MLQRKLCALLASLLSALALGCEPNAATPVATSQPATQTSAGAIVSLSPAATELLLAIDARDRLVGVSTFDTASEISALPRVGDYENVDWEGIATLAPRHMIVQMIPSRLPTGFRERAAKLRIALHTSHIDRLDDITREAAEIGAAIGHGEQASAFIARLQQSIAAARATSAGRAPVRTMIVISDDGLGLAGRDTYLNDLLEAAGGENVLALHAGRYVHVDREAMLALSPEAIVHLLPSPSAAQREGARNHWSSFSNLPAVKNGRVLVMEDAWALIPGAHVGELAERMARWLHPK